MQGVVKISILHGMTTFKRDISPAKLMRAWVTKNYDAIREVVSFGKFGDHLEPAMRRILDGARAASRGAIEALPAPTQASLRYDVKNPRIADYIANRTGHLITTSEDGMRAAVSAAVKRSMTNAISPRQAAGEIIGSIGLNERQAIALANKRTALETSGHSPAKQSEIVDAYADKLLDDRAMMIAATEIRAAQNEGQQAVWEQADEDGLLPDGVKRAWIVDGRPCEICLPMDGVAVGLDEPWTLPDGTQVDSPTESHPFCMCMSTLDLG